jgi:hypothetical protein
MYDISATPSPAFISHSSGEGSMGEAISRLSWELDRPLLGWQALVATGATQLRADGSGTRWRWPLVTITVPRQAGKTHLIAMVAIQRCLDRPDSKVYYSAQSRGDALMRWREFAQLIRSTKLVESRRRGTTWDPGDFKIRTSVGDECIEFTNGSELRIFAPQEDSLHGSVTDLVILDEVRFHDLTKGEALLSAILPSQVTRDGQVWIVSTSGDGRATWLAKLVENGRAAVHTPDAQQYHAEWAIPEDVEDGELMRAVKMHHPAHGVLLKPDALKLAYDQMSASDFAREYGNRWTADVSAMDVVIPEDVWADSSTTEPLPDGAPCFGVDVSLDRSMAAIVACVGGTLEVVDVRAGAAWLPARLRELCAKWEGASVCVDTMGPAGTLTEALAEDLGAQLIPMGTRNLVTACMGFYDALTADTPSVHHRPHPQLDEAAVNAEQRRIGQSWAWSRTRSGGPVLMAATLAWWGHATVPAAVEAPMIW